MGLVGASVGAAWGALEALLMTPLVAYSSQFPSGSLGAFVAFASIGINALLAALVVGGGASLSVARRGARGGSGAAWIASLYVLITGEMVVHTQLFRAVPIGNPRVVVVSAALLPVAAAVWLLVRRRMRGVGPCWERKGAALGLLAAGVTVLVLGLRLKGGGGSAGLPAQRSDDAPTLLLITLDTLRSDVLGCYGAPAPSPSPRIDRLAADGVRFANAFAQVPITLPSHTSMMSGRYPFRHGVRRNGAPIGAATARLLAQRLIEEGWATGAFTAAFPLARRFGLDRGFDHYLDPATSLGPHPTTVKPHVGWLALAARRFGKMSALSELPADVPVTRALQWMERNPGHPLFVWVHLYDPHMPLTPPSEFRGRHQATAEERARVARHVAAGTLLDTHGRPVARLDPGLYRDEVAFADAQVGRLLDGLEALGRLDSAWVLLTADHGEALAEHGYYGHAAQVIECCMAVPLVVRRPGAVGAGRAREDLAELVDVAPTLLAAAGLPPAALDAAEMDGRDLFAAGLEQRWVYSESLEARDPARHRFALRTARWTYWRDAAGRAEGFFDRSADPREMASLIGADLDETAAHALAEARERLAALRALDRGDGAEVEIDAETRRRLHALGYM